MSRQAVAVCDSCGLQQPPEAPGWQSWRGLDLCPSCASVYRPVGDVLAFIRHVIDADAVRPEDIIPPKTRPRRSLPAKSG